MRPIAITPLLLLSTTTFAQDRDNGHVQADVTSNEVVEARPGETGSGRFEPLLPADLAKYRPYPFPRTASNLSQRRDRAERFVSYDVRTGEERTDTLEFDPFRTQNWISGRNVTEAEDEGDFLADFGSFTKQTSTAFPWSAQCRIYFEQDLEAPWGETEYYQASGTLIDGKNLITAGHCVHEGNGGSWSKNMIVIPRFDGDSNAFGYANGIALAASAGWKSSRDWNDDMGWIRLDRPVGFLTDWFGSFYNTSDSWWDNTTFHVAGYPGEESPTFPDAPDALYYSFGSWNSVYAYQVVSVFPSTDTFAGMSGSGPYYKDSAGVRWVGGAFSHENPVLWWWDRTATRNTQGKFNYFHDTFEKNGYSSTQVDYVPLKVRTTGTTIARGHTVGSLSYLVANSSLYNPASATVNVSVYLSANDNITVSDTRIQQHSFTQNFGARTTRNVSVSGVTIPASTAPGTYYVGVIVTSSDADASNNDTDGWDAQRVTITN